MLTETILTCAIELARLFASIVGEARVRQFEGGKENASDALHLQMSGYKLSSLWASLGSIFDAYFTARR